MAQCPICGAPVHAAENQVCENCRRSSYTAYTDAQGRPVFASDVPQQPARRPPSPPRPMTRILVAANFAVFLMMVVSGVSFWLPNTAQIIQWGGNGPAALQGESWRLFSAAFVHIGILHIALNMWCLWQLGGLAEQLIGRWSLLMAYLLTGAAGNILSLAWNPNQVGAGASGAIFGIAGVLITLLKFGRSNAPPAQVKFVLNNLVTFAVMNLIIGASFSFISNTAHIGGLVCGLIIGFLLSLGTSSRESYLRTQIWVFPLIAGVLVVSFIAVRQTYLAH